MATLGGGVKGVYFEGKMDQGIALTGQIAGRIEEVKPVAQIIEETRREFFETVDRLTKDHS